MILKTNCPLASWQGGNCAPPQFCAVVKCSSCWKIFVQKCQIWGWNFEHP